MRLLTTILFSLVCLSLSAQKQQKNFEVPDYEKLRGYAKTEDYKRVLYAYLSFRDSLTFEEYRNFYYGTHLNF